MGTGVRTTGFRSGTALTGGAAVGGGGGGEGGRKKMLVFVQTQTTQIQVQATCSLKLRRVQCTVHNVHSVLKGMNVPTKKTAEQQNNEQGKNSSLVYSKSTVSATRKRIV